jgi:uncharacterized membrane protein YjjP (DUF1212 family)
MYLMILIWVIGGFAALCAARERHQRDLFGHALSPLRARVLRVMGWGLLGLTLLVAVNGGWAQGFLIWVGSLSIGAFISILMLTHVSRYRQKRR